MLLDEKGNPIAEGTNDTTVEEKIKEAVAEALKKAKEEHEARFNQQMAKMRKEKDDAVIKAKEEVLLSAEEKAKKEKEEELKETQEENARLKRTIKEKTIAEKLAEQELPIFLKNDSRLVNGKDEEIEDVVKLIAKEFKEATVNKSKGTPPPLGTGLGSQGSGTNEIERLMKLK